jgi:hypothetical protein
MATTWRVLTNNKWWDQPKYNDLVKNEPSYLKLPQSLGAVSGGTENDIKIGDEVIFHHIFKIARQSVHKIVMRGKIISTVQMGDNHRDHPCNKGTDRPHAKRDTFIWVEITEIYQNPEVILFNNIRHTWLKI